MNVLRRRMGLVFALGFGFIGAGCQTAVTSGGTPGSHEFAPADATDTAQSEGDAVTPTESDGSAQADTVHANDANASTNAEDAAPETSTQAELPPACQDSDGDGFGEGCAAGVDCDDTHATCTTDCADEDGNQVADCAETAPRAVFLYDGSNGGGPDSTYEGPLGVLSAAGIPVDHGTELPADVVSRFGVLVFLNPRDALPESVLAAARQVVRRGGRVVSFVDHSGYGGHAVGATLMARVGSTLRSEPTLLGGWLDLTLADVPLLTEGVSSLEPYFSASIHVGDGIAFGVTGDGGIAVGYEEVGRGDVVVVGDSSMLGFALDRGGNRRFIANLANLRAAP